MQPGDDNVIFYCMVVQEKDGIRVQTAMNDAAGAPRPRTVEDAMRIAAMALDAITAGSIRAAMACGYTEEQAKQMLARACGEVGEPDTDFHCQTTEEGRGGA